MLARLLIRRGSVFKVKLRIAKRLSRARAIIVISFAALAFSTFNI
jgi:hypothetical protein